MKEFISKLTWVDYIAFVAVLRGLYVGYKSGLFPELLRIAAYLVTLVVAFRFKDAFGEYLTLKTFLNQTTATGVSFLILLSVTFAVTKLVTMLILKMLKAGEGAPLLGRLTGAFVGAGRWLILTSLLFMLIENSPLEPLKKDIKNSVTGPQVAQVSPMLFEFLSKFSPQLAVSKEPGKTA